MQRARKPSKETEYSKYNKPLKPSRKFSLSDNNVHAAHRSTHSLALCSTKAPINNLRKSVSSMSIHPHKECGTQTVDTTDDFFLKDSIIRYPSASTIRSSASVRPPSAHQTQTCSKGHQMEPEEQPRQRFRSHFHDRQDEHCEKVERHITNLNEFLERGAISKKPTSILKNSSSSTSSQKSNKNYINEFQRVVQKPNEGLKQALVVISDDDEDEAEKEKRSLSEKDSGAGDAKLLQLKAAEEDPNCPEGHVPLSNHERLEALKLAQKRKFNNQH